MSLPTASLIFLIPLAIVIAFATKGLSQYLAKTTMITVGEHVKRDVQMDLLRSLVNADTEIIENKHTGKFLGHLSHDVSMITNLISVVVLNLFKDVNPRYAFFILRLTRRRLKEKKYRV